MQPYVFLIFLLVPALATWIPPLDPSFAPLVDHAALSASYPSCAKVQTGGIHTMYKNTPGALVFAGKGRGKVDIKFKDSLYIFDQPIELTDENPCLVVPPFQPIDYIHTLSVDSTISTCFYEGTPHPVKLSISSFPYGLWT